MEKIIPPVDVKLLEKELTFKKFVRNTNNGNNEIYIFTHHDSPNLMRELGRLREITFREAGGGTGLEIDIDQYDTAANPFLQLIVWNPVYKEIVGGYRFIHGKNIPCNGKGCIQSATAHLFSFSEQFVRDYLPVSIELGRSFVQPEYQPTYNFRKGMYSLDNLWDGLGAIIIDNPDIQFFFGKMTMYPDYNKTARDLILYFLSKYFPDPDQLLTPKQRVEMITERTFLQSIIKSGNYEEDYKALIRNIRKFNENIPPLVNAYMNLSPTMRTFGTAINNEFGDVEETGILINIRDIYHKKKERHLSTYIQKIRDLKFKRKIRKKIRMTSPMLIRSCEFVRASQPKPEVCPKPDLPEYAFIGRSNVGKSSLINMLIGRKGLSRVSGTPGKTRLINHFLINKEWYLVDLPGYGYAKMPKTDKAVLEKLIRNYLLERTNLLTTFLLVDSRLQPQSIDLAFMEWMADNSLPFIIVFTKTDKLKEMELTGNLADYSCHMSASWDELPMFILSSAVLKSGQQEILACIAQTNPIFFEQK